MKSKKLIIILIIAFVIISISIFLILNYKKLKGGNTIVNQSEENIINSILNIKAYSAKLDVTIETNKNKNKYVISQKIENGEATQEVLEPENIAGVITKYDGKDLKVINNKLNLETTFQNCQYIVENRLWLDSFIKEYKESENKKVNSNKKEIILEVKNSGNVYNTLKKLYIDKQTGKPIKMEVEDINKKMLVYILYTEMTIS
jgi:hypothetical protein